MKKKIDIPDLLSDLLYKDLLGILDKEEKEKLQALCREYRIETPQPGQLLEGLEEAEKQDWTEAYRHFVKKTQNRKIGIWYRVAAVVVLFLGAGLFWYTGRHIPVPEPLVENTEILPVSSKAIVTLANGEQLELEGNTHRVIEADGTKFQADAGELVYQPGEEGGELFYNTITIPRGGEFRLVLADGTKVWINAGSQLKYPVQFKGNTRKVFLQGEAYFDVAKNEEKTFIVAASKGEIRVWGTSFNVRDYPEENKVVTTLETGKISYFSALLQKEVRIEPGYMLEDREGGRLEPIRVNTAHYCGWKDGKFIFENASVEEIMSTLERWYDISVFYANDRVRNLHFTGDLERYANFNKILGFMEAGGDVKFEINGNTIVVREK